MNTDTEVILKEIGRLRTDTQKGFKEVNASIICLSVEAATRNGRLGRAESDIADVKNTVGGLPCAEHETDIKLVQAGQSGNKANWSTVRSLLLDGAKFLITAGLGALIATALTGG